MYDATIDGFDRVRRLRDKERINAVVVLTDGADTDSSATAETVVNHVRGQGDSAQQVRVFTIAYSPEAGGAREALEDIAKAWAGSPTRATPRTSNRCTRADLQLLLMGPYSRGEFNRALIANALLSPFNVVLLALMLVAGLLLDVLVFVLPVAAVVYGIAAARTYFDEDEANKVLERERGRRRKAIEKGRLNPAALAPPIRTLLEGALTRERLHPRRDLAGAAAVRGGLRRGRHLRPRDRGQRLPGPVALRGAASRSPPDAVQTRLRQVKDDPSKAELKQALESQLSVLGRMETQLQRFYDEMERILVELDTVRGNLVSVSASSDSANQERVAAEARPARGGGRRGRGYERGLRAAAQLVAELDHSGVERLHPG